jgi:hypothetical protein
MPKKAVKLTVTDISDLRGDILCIFSRFSLVQVIKVVPAALVDANRIIEASH